MDPIADEPGLSDAEVIVLLGTILGIVCLVLM